MKQGTSYTQYNKHFLCRYWLRNYVIDEKIEGNKIGGEDVSSYWLAISKGEDIVNLQRKHYIALSG